MELHNLVSSLKCLVSNKRRVLLGGIRLGGSTTFTSSYRGSDRSEFRVRGWWCSVLDFSPHLSARLVCSCPAIRPLGFGAWRQRGKGSEYVRSRGSVRSRESVWFVSFGSLCVILSAFTSTFMHCITYMWWWDLCDMCALYFDTYIDVMSLGYAHLLCFSTLILI